MTQDHYQTTALENRFLFGIATKQSTRATRQRSRLSILLLIQRLACTNIELTGHQAGQPSTSMVTNKPSSTTMCHTCQVLGFSTIGRTEILVGLLALQLRTASSRFRALPCTTTRAALLIRARRVRLSCSGPTSSVGLDTGCA